MMKIFVKVKPNAKVNRVKRINENTFSVWVKERPKEGKANKAVVDVLAQYFGLAKSKIVLLKGKGSCQKILEVG
ncbi:MAG: DUF167 domain-containing protein, partial [Candidatus Omnitrophica bacterium]|nr:DUF167 domain-containing protein [Candidatus Omnitrophota bacterium]